MRQSKLLILLLGAIFTWLSAFESITVAENLTKEEIITLCQQLETPDVSWRREAARRLETIENLHTTIDVSLPALVRALRDTDTEVRMHAAAALGLLFLRGKEAGLDDESFKSTVPVLVAVLSDTNGRVREFAVQALAMIAPPTPEVAVAALGSLTDESQRVRELSTILLATSGATIPDAVSALLKTLKSDNSPVVRGLSARAIGQIGKVDASSFTVLLDAAQHEDPFVRREALRAIAKLGNVKREAIPVLSEIVRNREERSEIRIQAINALRGLGLPGSKIATMVTEILADRTEENAVRVAAVGGLGKVAELNASVVEALITALEDADQLIRQAAAAALGEVDVVTPHVIPALAKAAETGNTVSVISLGKIGLSHPREVLPILIAALKEKNDSLRAAAVEALAIMGPQAREARSALEDVAERDANANIRKRSNKVLSRIRG